MKCAWLNPSERESNVDLTAAGRSFLRETTMVAAVKDGTKGGDFRHLHDIGEFIAMELQARACDDANLPSIARLQVFEEALDRFLSRCQMYRPFFNRYRKEQTMLRDM